MLAPQGLEFGADSSAATIPGQQRHAAVGWLAGAASQGASPPTEWPIPWTKGRHPRKHFHAWPPQMQRKGRRTTPGASARCFFRTYDATEHGATRVLHCTRTYHPLVSSASGRVPGHPGSSIAEPAYNICPFPAVRTLFKEQRRMHGPAKAYGHGKSPIGQ